MRIIRILITLIMIGSLLVSCSSNDIVNESTAEEVATTDIGLDATDIEPDGEIDFSRFETVTSASDFNDLVSKLSDNSKSFLIEQSLKRIQASAEEDIRRTAMSKIFNNPLLYFDDHIACEVYHTYREYPDGRKGDEFRISWHHKECKEKFHTTCRVLTIDLESRMSKVNISQITRGETIKEINGIQCYYTKTVFQYDTYTYIVNDNTFLRINPDPSYVNEEDIYNLLCYGKELSEILEPFFVEE